MCPFTVSRPYVRVFPIEPLEHLRNKGVPFLRPRDVYETHRNNFRETLGLGLVVR